ncbi:cystathionine gamma-lyase, putative [Babesia caballi]|uniref:Cystathionine gamma-lyase, putative n=1 Tax=Babesia caballi TaxID=5871 RepID=A0AAV4LW97_BABCB|nr:cystathionine gamma-lyase, putative [Babesia caballi]
MNDEPSILTLGHSRKRLCDLLSAAGDVEDPTGVIGACRDLIVAIDGICQFLEPIHHEKEPQFVKACDSLIESSQAIEKDSDLESLLSKLQHEANEAILFLENVDLTVTGTQAFVGRDDAGQKGLLVSQRALRDELIASNAATDETTNETAARLASTDEELASLESEYRRLRKSCVAPGDESCNSPCDSEPQRSVVRFLNTTRCRTADASRLLSALDASPLKVVEEGADYIVYEYTLGESRTTLRVRDGGSAGLSLHLDPMDARAHAYLVEHLRSCKSRIQIAAVLQEALSLP